MTTTQTKPTRDMIWGEVMLCLEILALCAGIQPIYTKQFFENPNEIYSKYFINKLKPSQNLTKKGCVTIRKKAENKLNKLIASMDCDQFMSNEPLSAEAFFSYHRSKLRKFYFKVIRITE